MKIFTPAQVAAFRALSHQQPVEAEPLSYLVHQKLVDRSGQVFTPPGRFIANRIERYHRVREYFHIDQMQDDYHYDDLYIWFVLFRRPIQPFELTSEYNSKLGHGAFTEELEFLDGQWSQCIRQSDREGWTLKINSEAKWVCRYRKYALEIGSKLKDQVLFQIYANNDSIFDELMMIKLPGQSNEVEHFDNRHHY